MAQIRGPLGFYTVSQTLLVDIYDALSDSLGGAPQRSCVVPGEIVWDQCNCGLLAISPRHWFVSDEFPEGALGRGVLRESPCDLPWLVGEITIQVVRCAPTPEGATMISVPCSKLDAAAQILISDAYVTLTETISTLCELKATDQIVDYVLGEQVTSGPEADCVGSELSVFVGLYR